MTVKAVFFDLDGTLIDSLPSIRATFEEISRRMGLSFPLEDALSLVGIPLVDIAREMAGEDRVDEFMNGYRSCYNDSCKGRLQLFPGIGELLALLRERGTKMAVITSKRIRSTRDNLALLAIESYFDAVITPESVANPKPHPEPVLLALESLGVGAAEALMVGDTCFDIAAGNDARVATIAVTWGNYDEERLCQAKPTYTVDTVAELRRLILSL